MHLVKEGKCLLAVTSLEATNSVFNITSENNSCPLSTPGHWAPENGEELINRLNKFLELRPENDIKLHVKQVEKRDPGIKIGENEYLRLFDLDAHKILIIKELKRVK